LDIWSQGGCPSGHFRWPQFRPLDPNESYKPVDIWDAGCEWVK
jgi:hypothetical protein